MRLPSVANSGAAYKSGWFETSRDVKGVPPRVFKTGALNHSATLPHEGFQSHSCCWSVNAKATAR
jgi:hypothetical protein